MKNFYTPETFDPTKYQRSGWKPALVRSEFDQGRLRLILRVSTGRRDWPLFSLLPNFELGREDPILQEIKFSLNYYTHPMVERFVNELNLFLTDLYQVEIDINKVQSLRKEGFHSSNNF